MAWDRSEGRKFLCQPDVLRNIRPALGDTFEPRGSTEGFFWTLCNPVKNNSEIGLALVPVTTLMLWQDHQVHMLNIATTGQGHVNGVFFYKPKYHDRGPTDFCKVLLRTLRCLLHSLPGVPLNDIATNAV